ncbi:MAG: hypothetical protein ABFC62_11245 [Clostridiaceae bacterium]|nr:putative ABC transporter permease [Eubacteriales bacterium]
MNIKEIGAAFFIGGTLYVILELVYRRRSHISMFLAGGGAFLLLHALFSRYEMPLLLKPLVGMALITAVEFIAGYIVNIKLKRGVWDYSKARFNLYGQICLKFSLLWALLTLPAAFLSHMLSMVF